MEKDNVFGRGRRCKRKLWEQCCNDVKVVLAESYYYPNANHGLKLAKQLHQRSKISFRSYRQFGVFIASI